MSQTQEQDRPLLTIAVPTYNREVYLREFLEILLPQLVGVPDVELLVCNNASPDGTAELLREMLPETPQFRIVNRPENIGSDANLTGCFRLARGKYFWMCGDDDVLRPGAIASVMQHLRSDTYDIVYVLPEGFFADWRREQNFFRPDGISQVVHSPRAMILAMGTGVAFISAVIVNRDRALEVMEVQPESLFGTNLTQLSWSFALLANHRKSLILWQRWVSGRTMNSSFDAARIFGPQYSKIARTIFAKQPGLARLAINLNLRQWFPDMMMDMRVHQASNDNYGLESAAPLVKREFGDNPRYWFFVHPILHLPLPLALRWKRVLWAANHIAMLTLAPGLWITRMKSRRGAPPAQQPQP